MHPRIVFADPNREQHDQAHEADPIVLPQPFDRRLELVVRHGRPQPKAYVIASIVHPAK
jgi:hypothetical protein